MKLRNQLLILFIIGNIICVYSENSALNGSTWQKDGRSIGLGGGMNATEQETAESISINYFLPYQLWELSTRNIKVFHKTRWMNVEGLWSQTGDAVFLEDYLSLGASRCLSGSFMMGVKAGYYHFASINGEKGAALLSEIRCNYKPSEKMQISVYLFNPTGSKIKKAENYISMHQSFHIGVSFFPSKKAEWLFELEKIQQDDLIWHIGFEYVIGENFIIRTGISAQPLKPSWGIGGRIHRFKYALGANLHPVLGLSSCFSLQYNW